MHVSKLKKSYLKKNKMEYKVLIASAGLGNRLKGITKNINKALVSVDLRPAISHIIEKFPKDIEFVIPVGYKKELVIDFCEIAYPNRKFRFVEIDLFEGEGSGLGYSILQCKEFLQCPFIFTSNDTIVVEDIPPPESNWMGFSDEEEITNYRSIEIKNNSIINIHGKNAEVDAKAYIGLAGISNYEDFWTEMENGKTKGSIEIGESFGLRKLLEDGISPIKFSWYDTGDLEKLQHTRNVFASKKNKDHIILEKEEEAIYFVDQKVIKFSTDKDFISNRVKRTQKLKPFTPSVLDQRANFYSYEWISGSVMSKNTDIEAFKLFLDWIKDLWQVKELSSDENKEFKNIATNFYKNKTYQRVKEYFRVSESYDIEEKINGIVTPTITSILDSLDWESIIPSSCTRFHGDLHFENILYNKTDQGYEFKLLDWRQDFGGNIEYGDIYYDLAKLNHGLIVSHRNIHNELYHVIKKNHEIEFDFQMNYKNVEFQKYFYDWIEKESLDLFRVKTLTALIFLNIAALHHNPYDHLLFYLGKSSLLRHIRGI
jgi:choline kinase